MASRTNEKYDDGGGDKNALYWTKDIIKKISDNLSSFKTSDKFKDEERIKKILDDLNSVSSWIIPTPLIESKSNLKSIKYRNKGNAYFKSNDLDKACKSYTKSVAWAKSDSQELGMAYANRSAVLLKAKLIVYCLDDIQRALEHGYPDNLKAKLYYRKATCLRILNSNDNYVIDEALSQTQQWLEKMNKKDQLQMKKMLNEFQITNKTIDKTNYKWDCQENPPKLKAENSMVPGLSDAVELNYSNEFGRHIIATRDISPGEILSVEKPYAKILNKNMKYKLCWHCGQQTWSGIPCDNCAGIIFCSKICQENSNSTYHDEECYINKIIFSFGLPYSLAMGIRLSIMALKESNNSVEILKNNIDKINETNDPLKKGFINDKLNPDKYASVYSLISHRYNDYYKESISLVGSIVTSYFLMKKYHDINNFKNNLKLLQENELFIFFVGFIEKNNWIMSVNIFEAGFFVEGYISMPSMTAISPAASFYNHSCVPMIQRNLVDGYLVNTSVCPIKKGQQIFETYGESYFTQEKKERQNYLKDHHFVCKCEACVNNWPIPVNIYNSKESEMQQHLRFEIIKFKSILLKQTKFSYSYYRENNKIYDITEYLNEVSNLVVRSHHLFKKNSIEIVEATTILMRLVCLSNMKPFVLLN